MNWRIRKCFLVICSTWLEAVARAGERKMSAGASAVHVLHLFRFIAILLVILGLTADQVLDEFIEFSVNILEKQGVDAEERTAELKVYIDKLLERYHINKDMRLLDPHDRSNSCKL
jgi:hypothetical protein